MHAEGERYVETESGWVKLVHVVTMVGPGVSVAVVESRMVVLGKPLSGQTGKEGACSHGSEVNGGRSRSSRRVSLSAGDWASCAQAVSVQ